MRSGYSSDRSQFARANATRRSPSCDMMMRDHVRLERAQGQSCAEWCPPSVGKRFQAHRPPYVSSLTVRLDGIEEVLLRKWWRSKARRDPFSGAAGLPASFARGRHPARLAHRSFACDGYRRLGGRGALFHLSMGNVRREGFGRSGSNR
jgi:hypothetical protein